MKKCSLSLFVGIFITSFLIAGPFGIDMGDSFSKLEEKGFAPLQLDTVGYYFVTPKEMHPDFDIYLVRIDASEGVFFIKAVGKNISDNQYGTNTKFKFRDIRNALETNYGKSELTDILLPRALWKNADDWLMSIRQSERIYFTVWESKVGSVIPPEFKSIYLAVQADSSTKGYLVLEYYGTKHSILSEKAKQEAASVF